VDAIDVGVIVTDHAFLAWVLGAAVGGAIVGAVQSDNIGGTVATLESAPTWVLGPIFLEFLGFTFTGRHRRLLRF
jgi:hypothetical protein